MSLGYVSNNAMSNNGNGNRNMQLYRPETMGISISNPNGIIDATNLRVSFWGGMAKVSIHPKLTSNNMDGFPKYDTKAGIAIHLTPLKVSIFIKQIKAFLEDMRSGNYRHYFYGVNTNKGLIGISNGKEFGKENTPCLIVRHMTDGQITNTFVYEFKGASDNFGVVDFDQQNSKFGTIPYPETEIEVFLASMEEYLKASTNAVAASYISANNYNHHYVTTAINDIRRKLGIQYGSSANNTGNFFKTNAQPQSSYSNIEDAVSGGSQPSGGSEDFF